MGMPVVIATNGRGIPVTVSGNGFGVPCTIATNGYGVPVVQAAAGSAGMAVTGITFGAAAPAAPTLTLITPNTDTTPDLTLSGDLVVGDTVRFQYSTSAGFGSPSELTNTIDAAEDSANTITFTTGALALGAWYFRARIERPVVGNSGWSNTETVTLIAASATTWSASDKSLNVTLSGSNLIATHIGPTGAASGRATPGQTTGKWYWEVVLTGEASGPGEIFIGIAISTAPTGSLVGFSANTIGIGNQESVWRGGTSLGNATGSLSVGENIGIAWDKTNNKIHFRLQGGTWNGVGGDNPATNTGGFDISAFGAGTYMPAYTMSAATDAVTAKFSAPSWAYAAPSGFSQLP